MTNEGWTGTATTYTDYWPDGVPVNDVYEKAWTYSNSTGRVSSTTQ